MTPPESSLEKARARIHTAIYEIQEGGRWGESLDAILTDFAASAVALEREECAKIAERFKQPLIADEIRSLAANGKKVEDLK